MRLLQRGGNGRDRRHRHHDSSGRLQRHDRPGRSSLRAHELRCQGLVRQGQPRWRRAGPKDRIQRTRRRVLRAARSLECTTPRPAGQRLRHLRRLCQSDFSGDLAVRCRATRSALPFPVGRDERAHRADQEERLRAAPELRLPGEGDAAVHDPESRRETQDRWLPDDECARRRRHAQGDEGSAGYPRHHAGL